MTWSLKTNFFRSFDIIHIYFRYMCSAEYFGVRPLVTEFLRQEQQSTLQSTRSMFGETVSQQSACSTEVKNEIYNPLQSIKGRNP